MAYVFDVVSQALHHRDRGRNDVLGNTVLDEATLRVDKSDIENNMVLVNIMNPCH